MHRIIQTVLVFCQQHRFALLFYSLLATIGARPVLKAMASTWNPMGFFLALILVVAIVSSARERDWTLPVLGMAFLCFHLYEAALGHRPVVPPTEAVWVIACTVVAANAFRHVMSRGIVNLERIFAAMDAYILTAIIFGVCYWLLNRAWPGSFGKASMDSFTQADAIYFSFVTIATLGYGDIVPTSDPARGLVMLEAVGSQLYLTILVARLVTLYERDKQA